MKVLAFPADENGCGYLRSIWPCEALRAQGHDVSIIETKDRRVQIKYNGSGEVQAVGVPDCDVVLFQRVCDERLVDVVRFLRERRNIATVVDVDDDLSAIHPSNPAWQMLDPNRARREVQEALRQGKIKPDQADRAYSHLKANYHASWLNLIEACKLSTYVTVSTQGLLRRYAAHGRGQVINNYLPEHYYGIEHTDNDVVGWPASLHSHPNDPMAVGNAIARLVDEGVQFACLATPPPMVRKAFGLRSDPLDYDVDIPVMRWHEVINKLGIGITPLADTRFNLSKSWLKPLELSAVGVPWVASPRAEYVKIHKMGAGLLAEKPRQWHSQLRRLVDEPALRADLAAAGREVASGLRLSTNAWHWAEAFETALRIQRGAQRDSPKIDMAGV